jgi:hypothetical protein
MRAITGVVVLAVVLYGTLRGSADAQHMFLDVGSDGVSSASDKLSQTELNSVDVWVETDKNRDGTRVRHTEPGARELTINHYEFVLRAMEGEVEWGSYANLQKSMNVAFGPLMNATDYYTGFGGRDPLPPGKYRLGTLTVRVKSGNPRLVFAASSSLWGSARTSFGSQYVGKDGDNTLKFTEDRTKLGFPEVGVGGDWADASGLEASSEGGALAAVLPSGSTPSIFSVSVFPNPANPYAVVRIQTTRAGRLRVRIFDISGRHVRTIVDKHTVGPGVHLAEIPNGSDPRPLASGVYVYRVEAAERTVTGRLVILK